MIERVSITSKTPKPQPLHLSPCPLHSPPHRGHSIRNAFPALLETPGHVTAAVTDALRWRAFTPIQHQFRSQSEKSDVMRSQTFGEQKSGAEVIKRRRSVGTAADGEGTDETWRSWLKQPHRALWRAWTSSKNGFQQKGSFCFLHFEAEVPCRITASNKRDPSKHLHHTEGFGERKFSVESTGPSHPLPDGMLL